MLPGLELVRIGLPALTAVLAAVRFSGPDPHDQWITTDPAMDFPWTDVGPMSAAAIVMCRAFETVFRLSTACTVNDPACAVVGVPEILPAVSVRPAGSEPAITLQVTVPVLLADVRVWL
jgi:hypothetical protein